MNNSLKNFSVVIHAKADSSRLFRKNFSVLNSVPLYLTQAINFSKIFDRNQIYIDTDSKEILKVATINGFSTIKRRKNLATNNTGGVRLLKEFITESKSEFVIQAFPTGPLVDLQQVLDIIEQLSKNAFDSAFLMANESYYSWKDNSRGYKLKNGEIPNSVELDSLQYELPTLYFINKKAFLESGDRISKNYKNFNIQSKFFSKDIDYLEDLIEVKSLFSIPKLKREFNWSEFVRTPDPPIIFFDIDGTLTDGNYNSKNNGELFKSFNTYDGIAIQDIKKRGIKIVFITASKTKEIISSRAKLLGVDVIFESKDKLKKVKEYSKKRGFSFHETMYVGNDVNDLDCLFESGYPISPNNSSEDVKKISKVLHNNSSEGIVREIHDNLLKSKSIRRIDLV